MRKVVLYIAMSLDGYIADKNGGVNWISGDGSDADNAGSFPEFIETVDTIVLGYRTYRQIITELSPDHWPYLGKKSYVLTHRTCENTKDIMFKNNDIKKLLVEIKAQSGKDIWVCGGADIVNQLIHFDLIDLYWITIIPTLLGEGIRLFQPFDSRKRLRLLSVKSYNGMVDLIYDAR